MRPVSLFDDTGMGGQRLGTGRWLELGVSCCYQHKKSGVWKEDGQFAHVMDNPVAKKQVAQNVQGEMSKVVYGAQAAE